MSSREPTLADVAELAGVSLTTVSRVLNNRGYLSEKTKKNVADAIQTLGYRPNSLARALHGKRTQTVGLIVPAVSLPFFGELAVEVENALAEAGYRILICNSMGRADRERVRPERALRERGGGRDGDSRSHRGRVLSSSPAHVPFGPA